MPYYAFKEIWTPFRLIGLRFFIENDEGTIWYKLGNHQRKRLFRKPIED